MPVAERPAQARDKGPSRFKEKHKVGRCVDLLIYGLLVMVTSDVAFLMFGCEDSCPARTCIVASDFDEKGLEATVFANRQLQEYCTVIEPPPDLHRRFEHGFYDMKSNQDYEIPMRNGSNSAPKEMAPDIEWYDREEDADTTKKKYITVYEDVCMFFSHMLHDFALYKDQDAVEFLFSDDIAYNRKAMLDSALFMRSF